MLQTHSDCEAQRAKIEMSYQQVLQMRQILENRYACAMLHTGKKCRNA